MVGKEDKKTELCIDCPSSACGSGKKTHEKTGKVESVDEIQLGNNYYCFLRVIQQSLGQKRLVEISDDLGVCIDFFKSLDAFLEIQVLGFSHPSKAISANR